MSNEIQNPYSAPETKDHLGDPQSHFKAIRNISRILRVVGWIAIAVYGSISIAASLAAAYRQLFAGPDWVNPFNEPSNSPLFSMGIVIGYAGMAWIGWLYVRTGRRLIQHHTSAYREALLLSVLLLTFLPLTLVGIYNIVQLRKHWRAYCKEQQAAIKTMPEAVQE